MEQKRAHEHGDMDSVDSSVIFLILRQLRERQRNALNGNSLSRRFAPFVNLSPSLLLLLPPCLPASPAAPLDTLRLHDSSLLSNSSLESAATHL